MIRVLIADDHQVVRSGLEQLLATAADIELVGMAADGAQAVALVAELQPDIVLMDLSMPELDGVGATRRIAAAGGPTQVVVLTSFSDRQRILDALDAGAAGYVLKHAEPDELLEAIRAAHDGGAPLDPKAALAIRGAQVILVDDVLTSGATSDACVRTLKRAGAAKVVVACFARVLDEAEG